VQDVSKIHPEDLADMRDFVDLVRDPQFKRSLTNETGTRVADKIRRNAQDIAQRYGFDKFATDTKLATAFGKALDAAHFLSRSAVGTTTKVPVRVIEEPLKKSVQYTKGALGRFTGSVVK
jgi:hypothetical protein